MSPSVLLMAEVVGMVGLALVGTAFILRWPPAALRPRPADRVASGVPVTILCPRLSAPARVRLAPARRPGGALDLSVLACDQRPAEGCDEACFASMPRA